MLLRLFDIAEPYINCNFQIGLYCLCHTGRHVPVEQIRHLLSGVLKSINDILHIAVADKTLYRPFVHSEDILENEHLLPDGICKLRIVFSHFVENGFFVASVHMVHYIRNVIHTADHGVVRGQNIIELMAEL